MPLPSYLTKPLRWLRTGYPPSGTASWARPLDRAHAQPGFLPEHGGNGGARGEARRRSRVGRRP